MRYRKLEERQEERLLLIYFSLCRMKKLRRQFRSKNMKTESICLWQQRKVLLKKTPIQDYMNVRKTGLAAISLREDDLLIEVKVTDNAQDILLVTKYGQCIRFNEKDVRSTGRVSMGVRGMNLSDNDEIIGMQMSSQGKDMLIVSEKGMGKRTSMEEFTKQKSRRKRREML